MLARIEISARAQPKSLRIYSKCFTLNRFAFVITFIFKPECFRSGCFPSIKKNGVDLDSSLSNEKKGCMKEPHVNM